VLHGQFDISHKETNTNICGDWGVLRFSGTGTFTVVDFGDGVLQVQVLERATYTLTFLDEPQETWDSRFVQAFTFNATPGGTTVQTFAQTASKGRFVSMRRRRWSSGRTDPFASTTPPSSWTSALPPRRSISCSARAGHRTPSGGGHEIVRATPRGSSATGRSEGIR
jgi:hypothetical protein